MGTEIERKFLVTANLDDLRRESIRDHQWFGAILMEQCYLPDTGDWAIRVRKEASWASAVTIGEDRSITYRDDWDRHAFWKLTMKRRQTAMTNIEIEENIFHSLYDEIAEQCGHHPLRKVRWNFLQARRFTVDEFLNPEFNGLLLAEIELESEDEEFERPDWLGEEVTGQKEYANAFMVDRLRF